MDLQNLLDKFITEISVVWGDIAKNWESFLTILIIYTIIEFLIIRQYYKHQSENIKSDRELLNSERRDYDTLKKEHAEYKAEIESKEYQAYLIAIQKSTQDLLDKEMFQGKKKKKNKK